MLSVANLMLSAMDLLKRTGSWLTMASLLLEWMRMTTMMRMVLMLSKMTVTRKVRKERIAIFNEEADYLTKGTLSERMSLPSIFREPSSRS